VTVRVLKSWEQNRAARATLQARGLSYWPAKPPRSLADRLRGRGALHVGDLHKSWDVLLTIELLERAGLQREPIIDLGAFASETPIALHRAGFRDLTGIDLDPRMSSMPFRGAIRWLVGDATATGLAAGSFAAVIAISSIEHGPSPEPFLREAARLLRPGGVFIASTDYWPDKIDTSATPMFGMPWRIFSRTELCDLLERARSLALEPTGTIELDADEAPIDCAGHLYTFAWLALRKC
jgi:SAM-dependent methyltransferase